MNNRMQSIDRNTAVNTPFYTIRQKGRETTAIRSHFTYLYSN